MTIYPIKEKPNSKRLTVKCKECKSRYGYLHFKLDPVNFKETRAIRCTPCAKLGGWTKMEFTRTYPEGIK